MHAKTKSKWKKTKPYLADVKLSKLNEVKVSHEATHPIDPDKLKEAITKSLERTNKLKEMMDKNLSDSKGLWHGDKELVSKLTSIIKLLEDRGRFKEIPAITRKIKEMRTIQAEYFNGIDPELLKKQYESMEEILISL